MTDLPLDRNSFVTSVTLAFLSKVGLSALEWDPLIVRDAFEGIFQVNKMPQRLFDKLNCGLALIGTSSYTTTIEGFLTGTACMNNLVLDASIIPFVTVEQCAWGIWEYINLNGDIDANGKPSETFSPDIIKYIQEAGKLNGIFQFPNWMQFAQIPDSKMPDLSSDIDQFEQFMARQNDYVNDMTSYVTKKQDDLKQELLKLKDLGFIAK